MRLLLIFSLILAGCTTTSGESKQVQKYNDAQEAVYGPTRAKFTRYDDGATSLEFGAWAGTVGMSVANDKHKNKTFEVFKKQCGLDKSALKEVRVVKHEPPVWYEVWVFNNPLSKRHDKESGMSVVMKYDASANITNTFFYGKCK